MAFLSNEIKFYSKNMSATNLIGPGFYELNNNFNNVKENLIPFSSSEKRKNIFIKINDFPGPGTYNLTFNEKSNKNNKNLSENDKNLNENNKNLNENDKNLNKKNKKICTIDNFDAFNNNIFLNDKNFNLFKNKENFGFNSQTKRFFNNNNFNSEEKNENNKFLIINNNNNNNKTKTFNFYHNYNYQQFKSNLTNKNNLKKNSIPKKNFIGYFLDENENLITIENTDLNNIYSGLEGNQIGPGNYNLNLKWEKKNCLWSLSKNKRGLINNFKENLEEKIKENIKNKENEILINKKNNKNLKLLTNKINNVKYNIKNNNNNNNNNKNREIIFNKCFNNFPGPGYYYNNNNNNNNNNSNENNNNSNVNNNKNNNFGSEQPRFNYELEKNIKKNIRIPSPTKYFNMDLEKLKKLHNNLFKLPNSYREIKYNNNNKKIPFLTTSQRFDNTTSNKKINFLNINPPLKKTSFNSKLTNFNSSQRIFFKNFNNNNPGPGSYINPYTGEGNNNTVFFNGILTSIETARKNNHSKSSINIIKNNNNIKLSPDVGEYFPETIKSIEYENLKKTKPIHAAFNVSSPKKLNLFVNSSVDNNIGPGSYFNEKEIVFKQKNPPFNVSENKEIKLKKNHSEKTIFNDFNNFYQFRKKEFNILYIN